MQGTALGRPEGERDHTGVPSKGRLRFGMGRQTIPAQQRLEAISTMVLVYGPAVLA